MSTLENPVPILSILLYVFKIIQVVKMEKGKIETSKPKSEVLHDSLKEEPLPLSISQDPSSAPKINKCLCIVLFSKIQRRKKRNDSYTER